MSAETLSADVSKGQSDTRRKPLVTPINVLFQTRGRAISIELRNGETINGTVMRADKTMNVVLKNAIRTSADGVSFWKTRQILIRGSSIKNIRMDAKALEVPSGAGRKRARPTPLNTVEGGGAPKSTETKTTASKKSRKK